MWATQKQKAKQGLKVEEKQKKKFSDKIGDAIDAFADRCCCEYDEDEVQDVIDKNQDKIKTFTSLFPNIVREGTLVMGLGLLKVATSPVALIRLKPIKFIGSILGGSLFMVMGAAETALFAPAAIAEGAIYLVSPKYRQKFKQARAIKDLNYYKILDDLIFDGIGESVDFDRLIGIRCAYTFALNPEKKLEQAKKFTYGNAEVAETVTEENEISQQDVLTEQAEQTEQVPQMEQPKTMQVEEYVPQAQEPKEAGVEKTEQDIWGLFESGKLSFEEAKMFLGNDPDFADKAFEIEKDKIMAEFRALKQKGKVTRAVADEYKQRLQDVIDMIYNSDSGNADDGPRFGE